MSDQEQIQMGENPDEVGEVEAVMFLVEYKGRKTVGRIMLRQGFESGRAAADFCKPEEKRLAALHNTECGTLYLRPGVSQFDAQRLVNDALRDV